MATSGPEGGLGGAAPGSEGGEGGASGDFVLETPVPAGRKRIHWSRTLAEYGDVYGVTHKSVKRWVAMGKKSNDLPPLDAPGKMAGWWRRHSSQKPSDRLLELETDVPAAVAVVPEVAPVAKEKIASLDLGSLELGDDDEVRQARSIVQANYMRLQAASTNGDADGVRRWQPLWRNAVDQLCKIERAAREKYQKMGRLIDRQATEAEIAQTVEALRLMRMIMPSKIRSALEGLVDGKRFRRVLRLLGVELEAAVALVRDREDALLHGLGQFGSAGEFAMAAEAA